MMVFGLGKIYSTLIETGKPCNGPIGFFVLANSSSIAFACAIAS